ncbi:MAG: cyclic nucleotide-binding domain-containing protein [Pyrinomonadaceae bacterium]
MQGSEIPRKTFKFFVTAGVIVIALLALPSLESWILPRIAPGLGLNIGDDGKLVDAAGRPPGMMAETTIGLFENVFHILTVVLAMALVVVTVRFLTLIVFKTILRTSAQSEVASLARSVLSIVIYIVAFFIIFQWQYPTIPLAPLFTGSTILGIVVGLALQDTLGNLFSGIALQADQPFQVGDVISLAGGRIGVVQSVSWRGVKIRTPQDKLLVISNSVLGKETIEVAPRNDLAARTVNFNTLYSNSPAKTIQVVREAVRQVENVSPRMRPVVRVRNLGDNGIDWEVKYWIEDYSRFNDTDALIRERIWYAFQRENIEFAYPTRTLHIETRQPEVAFEEKVSTIADRLSRVAIFSPLSDEEIDQVASSAGIRIYAPGEAIVRAGREGNSMFVITRGSVAVKIPDGSGFRTVNRLREDDFFGEMSLLTGEPRTATVVAEEETEVIQIVKSSIKPIFESNPEVVASISEIVEERRRRLNEVAAQPSTTEEAPNRGLLGTIRRFFGLTPV